LGFTEEAITIEIHRETGFQIQRLQAVAIHRCGATGGVPVGIEGPGHQGAAARLLPQQLIGVVDTGRSYCHPAAQPWIAIEQLGAAPAECHRRPAAAAHGQTAAAAVALKGDGSGDGDGGEWVADGPIGIEIDTECLLQLVGLRRGGGDGGGAADGRALGVKCPGGKVAGAGLLPEQLGV